MTQSRNAAIGKLASVISDEGYYYVGVNASPFSSDCTVFGLNSEEILALSKRFPNSGAVASNGVIIKGPPFSVINALAELGYRVICSAGKTDTLWTLQREL